MRHATDATLRRLVDEPAGVADADREHVADCPMCLSGLSRAAADDEPRAVAAAAPTGRWRAALRSPLVAAVGVAAVLAGAGTAAAADWLPIFRTAQVAPVTLTRADLVALPDLAAYGDVEVISEPDVRAVADAAAAEEATGIPVPQVGELPRGVTGDPAFRVGDRMSVVFTFSAEQAARTTESAGGTLPPPPPGLDGSRFRLVAGPGVAAVWQSAADLPALIVARAVAPAADSSGIPFEAARDYLLSLPGLPEDVAAQLRGFPGDGTTLPLPVPAEHWTSSATDVDGTPATVLTSRDGALAGVVWVADGVVTAVAGSVSADEVLAVARGLEQR